MSIAWMTRIWASAEPSRPTDRLMLLALADNANDEGCCRPSVETLHVKCRLGTVRGARRVLRRLEAGGFVRCVRSQGTSIVYELCAERLDTPKLQGPGWSSANPGTRGPAWDGTPGPGGQIERYDALCAGDRHLAARAGFVQAITERYPPPRSQRETSRLFTYREMLAWCEARGNLGLTRAFTPVKQDGRTFFRLHRSPK